MYKVIALSFLLLSGCASLGNKALTTKGNYDKQINDLSSELGVVKDNQNNLVAQMDAKLNAVVAGINNAVSNELKAGRDAINSMNDTGLMKVIMLILGVLLMLSLLGHLLSAKRMFALLKERQHYKTLAKGDYKNEVSKKG